MPSLTPLVRRLLLVWGVLWLLSFLAYLADVDAVRWLQLDPALLHGEWRSLPGVIGYAFVHNPTWVWHVALNALVLAWFGPEAEVLFPGRRFVRLFLIATLAGAAVHLLLSLAPLPWFQAPVVGGSGFVMAVIGVNAAVEPHRRVRLLVLECSMRSFFLGCMVLDALGFLASLAGKGGSVASDVHLAGAVSGWLYARGVSGWLERLAERRRRRGASAERERQRAEEAELDRILGKISRGGLPSLSGDERRFLERRARRRG